MWWPFKKREPDLPPGPQRVGVYWNTKAVLVTTQHSTNKGFMIEGEQTTRLKIDVEPCEFGQVVLEHLDASGHDVFKTGDEAFARATAAHKLLRKSGVGKGWEHLYIQRLDDGRVRLAPMHRCAGTQGYMSMKDDPMHDVPATPEGVGEKLREILDAPPLDPFVDTPSHT